MNIDKVEQLLSELSDECGDSVELMNTDKVKRLVHELTNECKSVEECSQCPLCPACETTFQTTLCIVCIRLISHKLYEKYYHRENKE